MSSSDLPQATLDAAVEAMARYTEDDFDSLSFEERESVLEETEHALGAALPVLLAGGLAPEPSCSIMEKELSELLREAWEFPDRPGPADGEVADDVNWDEQDSWTGEWISLNARIQAMLHRVEVRPKRAELASREGKP